MSKLSTKPYKGARDFYPKEKRLQNCIFNIWRETAQSFGYEEYAPPLLEKYELYEAKSGEDLVNNQLYSFEDRGGREVAIRPEKTPSLARMIAAKVKALPKPIRWFNIGNCWRYEKPQKGRGREFFQFDCDIFGVDNIAADVEVFSIPIEVMKRIGATEDMFEIRVNNRRFAEYYLTKVVGITGEMSEKGTQLYQVTKAIDSKPKISNKEFVELLEKAALDKEQVDSLSKYLDADLNFVEKFKEINKGAKEILDFFDLMEKAGYGKYLKYSPEIMRGLDYYTGMVIEQFDLNPDNNRAMYGGGRYDDLAQLFTDEEINGVGFAMGDMTLIEFLEGWNLTPELDREIDFYVTLWPSKTEETGEEMADMFEITRLLREKGKKVISCLEPGTSISDQLSTANKEGVNNVIIRGEKEKGKGEITVKNMQTGDQKTLSKDEFLNNL